MEQDKQELTSLVNGIFDTKVVLQALQRKFDSLNQHRDLVQKLIDRKQQELQAMHEEIRSKVLQQVDTNKFAQEDFSKRVTGVVGSVSEWTSSPAHRRLDFKLEFTPSTTPRPEFILSLRWFLGLQEDFRFFDKDGQLVSTNWKPILADAARVFSGVLSGLQDYGDVIPASKIELAKAEGYLQAILIVKLVLKEEVTPDSTDSVLNRIADFVAKLKTLVDAK